MYTKEEIWASISKEIGIIKHLFEKIPEGSENYKPTEKQRTMLELLQYLSVMGVISLRATLEDNAKVFEEMKDLSSLTNMDNFVEMMTKEEEEMKVLYEKFSDEEFKKVITRFGTTQTKALFILGLLKNFTAYKMQLFLYIKASGNHEIGTSNLWGGYDIPIKSI